MSGLPAAAPEPIAITGMGCRLGGARGPEGFWQLLRDGVDAVTEVPASRWDVAALYDPDPAAAGRMSTRWGSFVEDLDGFDSDFFSIAPVEAVAIDPQQRMVLEVAYEALEDAGIPAATLAGSRAGVYIGACGFDHGGRQLGDTAFAGPYAGTGSVLSIIANRLSYVWDLRGPSVAIDTACSSSLVAVHAACQALRLGEVPLALAGGVAVLLNPNVTIGFSKGGFMAPDGRCKTFDHRADGYVRGEGAGVVVLRRLRDAVAAGDRIYALVLGSAVNQDGRSNGLFAPNRLAQEALLRDAYRNAGVDPAAVTYVEAHGTGTALGDPIEVGALASVLTPGRDLRRPLRVGSVKTNVGHLEAAAGVVGLMKTVLVLHHRALVPNLHFEQPNPLLRLDRRPVTVQTRYEPLPPAGDGAAVTAGVSSFGFGGTNGHVVLSGYEDPAGREGPAGREDDIERLPRLLPVSARSEAALAARAGQWSRAAAEAAGRPDWLLGAAATAAHRRDHHEVRAAVVATTAAQAGEGLAAIAAGRRHPATSTIRRTHRDGVKPVFVFPGQGGQWVGMGRRLAATCPAFRAALERCDDALAPHLGQRLFDPAHGLAYDGTTSVQPAIFAMQVALAAAWRARGVEPAAVVGHSLGEVAAAHVAGALSLADAALVVCVRSQLLARLEGSGGMLIAEVSAVEAAELLHGYERSLAVAAVNGPRATVLAGGTAPLAEVEAELNRREVFVRRVSVDFAAHSPQVEPLQPQLRQALAAIWPTASAVPFHSTVTASQVAGTELGPDYWGENLRRTVRFHDVVRGLRGSGHRAFVELSPHPVIGRSILDTVGDDVAVLDSTRRDEDELATLLLNLGELYTMGLAPRWDPPPDIAPVSLPTYPWQPRHYPLLVTPVNGPGGEAGPAPSARSILGQPVRQPDRPHRRLYPIQVSRQSTPYLADHVVDRVALVPAALWIGACVEAARHLSGRGTVTVSELSVPRPLLLPDSGDEADLQLALDVDGPQGSVTVMSYADDGAATVHATAQVAVGPTPERGGATGPDLLAHCPHPVDVAAFYRTAEAVGIAYGPAFRGITELTAGDGEALARVRRPAAANAHSDTAAHPAFVDACLQAIGAALPGAVAADHLPLPVGVDQLSIDTGAAVTDGWCHVRVGDMGAADSDGTITVRVDLDCLDDAWAVRWRARGVTLRLLRREAGAADLLRVAWRPYRPAPTGAPAGHWLVLGDDEPLVTRIRDQLAARGATSEIWLTSDDTWADSSTWDTVGHPMPAGVICTWALTASSTPDAGLPRRAEKLAARTLRLAQAVSARRWPAEPPRLVILTAGCHPAPAAPMPPAPVGGALWGLGRCLANELPELRTTVLDLAGEAIGLAGEVAGAVLDPGLPGQISVGPGGCRVPAMVAQPRPSAGVDPVRLSGERSYLVTGGLGALGRHVAGWLVEHGARHLILVGRTAPGPAAVADLNRLRDRGGQVHVAQLDVADGDALAAAMTQWARNLPGLGGVVHCAGALADAAVLDTGPEHLTRTFAGKVAGAWHLHRLTQQLPLDLFVLFSSFAGVLGSPGQSAYAAANTMLDALAAYRRSRGEAAVSIAWGPWSGGGLGTWSGGVERLSQLGVPPLPPERALASLAPAVGSGLAQVVAVRLDATRFDAAELGPAAALLAGGDPPGISTGREAAVDVAAAGTAAPGPDDLAAFVHAAVAEVLGTEPDQVPTDVVFAELGFDSLLVMAVRRRLEQGLAIRLSAAVVWAHPTVDALVSELRRRRQSGERRAASHAGGSTGRGAAAETPPAQPRRPEPSAPSEAPPSPENTASSSAAVSTDDDLIRELAAQVELMKERNR